MVAPSGYLKQGARDPRDHDPPALVAFAVTISVLVAVVVGGGIPTHT